MTMSDVVFACGRLGWLSIALVACSGMPFNMARAAQERTSPPAFERWDRNGDGVLTPEELPAALRPNFDRVDRDGDGRITPAEHRQFLSARPNANRGPATEVSGRPAGRDSIKVERDIAYVSDGHERQVLDLYLPASSDGPRPLVIWIHGGAWLQGDKGRCPATALVDRGFVVASLNYRLSQHAIFPAQIHDCSAAIRWLRAHHEQYGIDPDKVGVWGASAGGHLAAMLGTSAGRLAGDLGNPDESSQVQAVLDWFGPSDLLTMNEQAGSRGSINHDAADSPESRLVGAAIQDVPDLARAASPLFYLSRSQLVRENGSPDEPPASLPPFLIVHGDQDTLVPLAQSRTLHERLRELGVTSELIVVEGAGHGQFRDPEITERGFAFFERVLLGKDDGSNGEAP